MPETLVDILMRNKALLDEKDAENHEGVAFAKRTRSGELSADRPQRIAWVQRARDLAGTPLDTPDLITTIWQLYQGHDPAYIRPLWGELSTLGGRTLSPLGEAIMGMSAGVPQK